MISKATTVAQYLAELPDDRRPALTALVQRFRDNLQPGFAEGMSYGMPGWFVPHSLYPKGYHCDPKQPLPFGGLASQKQHISVYLCTAYYDAEAEAFIRTGFAARGLKLDMGKSCIRFKKLEQVSLDIIGAAIARYSVEDFIAQYERGLAESKSAKKK